MTSSQIRQSLLLLFALGLTLGSCFFTPEHPDTDTYLIEDGKKEVRRHRIKDHDGSLFTYWDTISLTPEILYDRRPDKHPLRSFGLSYPEWATIHGMLSISENQHYDKGMIGLIEIAGTLRISYLDQTIRLPQQQKTDTRPGNWENTFANDSIRLTVTVFLEPKRILNRLTGFGTIRGELAGKPVEQDIYGVFNTQKSQ